MSAVSSNKQPTPFLKLLEQLRQEHDREVSEARRGSSGQGQVPESKQTLKNGFPANSQDNTKFDEKLRSTCRKGTPAVIQVLHKSWSATRSNDMSEQDDEDEEDAEESGLQTCRPGTPPRGKISTACQLLESKDKATIPESRSAWDGGEKQNGEDIEDISLATLRPGSPPRRKASPPPCSSLEVKDTALSPVLPVGKETSPALNPLSGGMGTELSPVLPVEKTVEPSVPKHTLAPVPKGPSPVILRMQAMARAAIRAKHEGKLDDLDEPILLPGSLEGADTFRASRATATSLGPRGSCLKQSHSARFKRSVSFDSVADDVHTNLKQRNDTFKLKKDWQTDIAESESQDRPAAKTESFRVSVIRENKPKHSKHSTQSELDESLQIRDGYVSDPNASHNFAWDLSGTLLVLLDYFFIPLQVFKSESRELINVLAIASSVFWTVDVVRTFFVGYHDKGILVMSAKHIRRHYFRTWAVFDGVLVSCNWALVIMLFASVSNRIATPAEVFRLLRGLKIYRVLKSVEERIESQHISIIFKIVKLLSSIVLMCHLIACAWFAIGETASKSTRSWLEEYGLQERSVSYKYTSSFHWALTQFTPASIAIQPTNVSERSFAIVTLLCALIMFSLFVSGITDALLDLRTLGNFKAKQFWLLRKYLSECNVPKEVSLRVQVYCSYAYENRMRFVQENTVNLLEMLSPPLRAELRTAIFEPRMAQHPLFVLINKVAPLTMQLLCTDAVARVMLAHGDMLFQSGQCASQMYFVTAGVLSYHAAKAEDGTGDSEEDGTESTSTCGFSEQPAAVSSATHLAEGSWVGEAVLWVEWTYVGSIVAQTECDLVSLDAEKFFNAVHSNMNTRAEASLYAKGFVLGLNRIDKAKVTDLFQSGLLEGLWFRLLNEYNVKRRGRPGVQSNSMLLNAKVAFAISKMFSKSEADTL